MTLDKHQLKIIKFSDYLTPEKAVEYIATQNYSSGKNYIRSIENNELSAYEESFLITFHDDIIGFFQIKKDDGLLNQPHEPWLCRLFVDVNYRGNRITEVVSNFSINYCQQFGFSKIYLSTTHKGLYEKFGWQKIGNGESKSGTKRDVFVYNQSLS